MGGGGRGPAGPQMQWEAQNRPGLGTRPALPPLATSGV